ncbi:MAG: serine/threonine-protein phosphatase [Firmicutes bacterium]|nr:serine/threonine-protein phosphatase [Bacillota bacterium]
MSFTLSAATLLNVFFIAMGISLCLTCLFQLVSSVHINDQIKQYFQVFFVFVLAYICTHLVRELLNGRPGESVRTVLYTVTFIEMLVAGFMPHMMSLAVLAASQSEKKAKPIAILLYVFLILHVAFLVYGMTNGIIFYFDDSNTYQRGSLYVLSNVGPILMLLTDIYLLVRYRDNFNPRVRVAFWVYIIAPLVAIAIQAVSYGVQFIILATVGAAAYMFSAIIREQTQQYEAQKTETSRIETELNMAKNIQENMLPNIFPAFPERNEFEIYASMNPAKEVGGDFYDFFLVDDNHLAMVMADVSGKGVPAALFMMISKTLIQNTAMTGISPKEILETVNNQICKNNREEMFVTVWIGILDLTNGKMVCANAGHEYPAIKKPHEDFQLLMDKHGLVVGAMEGIPYKEYEVELTPGAKIFLYTDGVPEATNKDNELFGTDRMIEALHTLVDESPEKVLEGIHRAVDDFVGDAPQFDDLTMLCLQYNGLPN